MNLDTIDLKILRELQRDGNISNVALAKRVNLSPSPCLARVKALRAAGVIRQYVALLDPDKLGLQLNVFIFITLKEQNRQTLEIFEQTVCGYEEVMECYLMTGDSDYLIRVAIQNIHKLEHFIIEKLSPISQIEGIRSSLALKQVRYKTALPLF